MPTPEQTSQFHSILAGRATAATTALQTHSPSDPCHQLCQNCVTLPDARVVWVTLPDARVVWVTVLHASNVSYAALASGAYQWTDVAQGTSSRA